jgi:G3E family GTPase
MSDFYLVTGFLGSGKTTFLKNILLKYSDTRRIAIIQNEFAASGIDGTELNLTKPGFKLVELNNGSVFCVCMLGSFIKSLEKILLEYDPNMIFLEASGLADPINIIEVLQNEAIRDQLNLKHIFTLVDAVNFERGMKTLPRFKKQIMIADTVIINKFDLYADKSGSLQDSIRKLNPYADILESSYCKTDFDAIIAQNKEHVAAETYKNSISEGRPALNACVLKSHEKFTKEQLNNFLTALIQRCPRVKGFVNMADGTVNAVQTVFDTIEIKEINGYTGPTEIIAFGEKLESGHLSVLMKKTLLSD